MGQLHGKAQYIEAVEPFLNASEANVNSLWETFNDVAEGFGLNKLEMLDVCSTLQGSFNFKSRAEMDAVTSKLFLALDTDENGLVDALEFLGTMAMVSAMQFHKKITFVFNCYDFDESGQISIDELTLSLKSTLTGLCKITLGNACPSESSLEEISMKAFGRAKKGMDSQITLQEFLDFCDSTPETMEWLQYHDDPVVWEDDFDGVDSDLDKPDQLLPIYTPKDAIVQDPDYTNDIRLEGNNQPADEFNIVKPWFNTISNAVPSNPPEISESPPDVSLHLEWIYGYSNAFRNNVGYLETGEIIYAAAASCVVYDIAAHSQRFCLEHTNLITCMSINPSRTFVATGERGLLPRICIWDPTGVAASRDEGVGAIDAPVAETNMKVLCTIRGFHRRGIGHLAWSPTEKSLLTVGLDMQHRLAVYTWPDKTLQGPPILEFAQATTELKVLACQYINANDFATCGMKHMFFWNRASVSSNNEEEGECRVQTFYKKKGCLGRKAKLQSFVSLTCLNDQLISGTIRGDIYIWEGRNCIQTIRGHGQSVTSLHSFGHGFVSGGKDGKIRIWSRSMDPGAQFDVSALGSIEPRIRSVAANSDGTKLLIGTAGGEIYEIAASDGCNLHYGPLVAGHCRDELWGLSMHPHKPEFCTAGDDQTIRIWDLESHRMARMTEMDTSSRTCAYSPDGNSIAIGFGSGAKVSAFELPTRNCNFQPQKKEGAFAIINEQNLIVQYEARDSKKWIRDIKFSPDGQSLGVSSQDNSIYLYNAADFASKGKCKKHTSQVTHFDFSLDCEYVQSNCGKHELLYFDAGTGTEHSRPSTLKDVEWATQTCPLGWSTQGLWAPDYFATKLDINAVDRSRKDEGKPHLLASGDNYGRVRLYRYPCVMKGSAYFEQRGHGHDVRNVRFHPTEPYLFSCGGEDRCIFQWRIDYDEPEVGLNVYEENINSDDEADFADGTQLDRTLPQELANKGDFSMDIMLEQEKSANDTEGLVPVKPWAASAIQPTICPNGLLSEEQQADIEASPLPWNNNLQLEFVHGYRSQNSRNNLFYVESDGIIFPAAKLGIVLNRRTHTQTFYRGHSDDVVAVAVHPNRKIVATGQLGRHPRLCIWDSKSLSTLRVFEGHHQRAICAMSFSSDGKLLASIGQDRDHSMVLYDWENGTVKATVKTDAQNKVLAVAFRPTSNSMDGKGFNTILVTCGVQHIKFWSLEGGRHLAPKQGLIGKKGMMQAFLCAAYLGENAVIGTANGQLYLFHGRVLQTNVIAHVRSVTALQACSQGLCTGGKDGFVKLWSKDLECTAEFNMADNSPFDVRIRAVDWRTERNTILVGTRGSEIFEISSVDGEAVAANGYSTNEPSEFSNQEDKKMITNKALIHGHFSSELWCIGMHPTRDDYCTVGDDKTLRVWDIYQRRQQHVTFLDTVSRACTYSPDGAYIAVGLGGSITRGKHKKDGTFLVFDASSMAVVHEARDTKQWITCILYSEDGLSLVCGSYDNSIYIYDVSNEYAKRATFTKHKSYITHIDITKDGQYLRSSCGGNELLFADMTTGSHVASASALKNQEWSSSNCVYHWSLKGVWPDPRTTTMVNAACLSLTKDIAVTGDNFGYLKMFRYPVFNELSPYKLFLGHSSDIRCIKFSQNNSHVLSVGGADRCIFQWRHSIDEEEDEARRANIVEDNPDLEMEGLYIPTDSSSGVNASDEMAAPVKSYMSAMVPPSNPPQEVLERPPEVRPAMEHVYGFRSQDVRNNMRYGASGRIVYHSASIGISYDQDMHQQSFYSGHRNNSIVSLEVSRDGRFVATGEARQRPRIHVWEAVSCSSAAILPAFHERAITYLSFSPCGQYLASVGQDENHSLAIWKASVKSNSTREWQTPILFAHSKSTLKKVLFVTFCSAKPSPISTPSSTAGIQQLDYDVVTGGTDHAIFWKIDSPGLVAMKGIFGNKAQIQPLVCAALVHQKFVTGTHTGHLYIWEGRTVVRAIQGHTGCINAIFSVNPTKESNTTAIALETAPKVEIAPAINRLNSGCVTGGQDGHVKLWSRDMTPLADFDIADAKPLSFMPSVRSVCWDINQNRVLVGTRASEIYELSCHGGNTMLLHESHCDDELFAVAPHPIDPNVFATGGDDKTVRVWSISKRCVVGKNLMDTGVKALCWSPDGTMLAVGLGEAGKRGQRKAGAFSIIDYKTMEIVHEGRESKKNISAMQFSPDGLLLAIGSHDNQLYLHNVLDNYKLKAKCDKSTGCITHIDFSTDGGFLRINSDAFELIFVNTLDGSWIPSPATMKDTVWATQNCVLSWPVQGMWPTDNDKRYIHACDRAHSSDIVAAGDNLAYIHIYNYPVLSKDAPSCTAEGHSHSVSNLCFSASDSHLISIGNSDRTVCQWKLVSTSSDSV